MTVGRLAKVLREAGRAQKRRGASESTVLKPSGRSKYGNRKTECRHWHTHDSKVEALRCNELHILQSAGVISGLEQQPRFSLDLNGVHICNYRADFSYYDNGQRTIEDVKGHKTADYKLKSKLMLAIYGIAVLET